MRSLSTTCIMYAVFHSKRDACGTWQLAPGTAQDIPLRFVREWFFEDVDQVHMFICQACGLLPQVLPLVWRNLSSLYRPGEGLFTLGV